MKRKGNWNPWNIGLTKETDERLARMAAKVSSTMKGKSERSEIHMSKGFIPWCKGLTKEQDERLERLSIRMIHLIEKGLHPICRKGHIPWNKGLTKETDERIKKQAEKSSGTRSHTYIHGEGYEPYSIEFDGRLKSRIRSRDGNRCVLCKTSAKLQVHHIDYNKHNQEESNLITLCYRCNPKVNFNRDFWKKYFQIFLSTQSV